MKRKALKLLSIVLSNVMIFGTVLPTSAYNLDEDHNSIESVEYQNTEDEDFTNVTNVFAELGSEYKVTIPKVVVLSGVSKAASYYVKVEGDIAGYEKVKVVPEDNFKLSAKNKADETATVNQDKTVWTVHDFDTDANGLIQAKDITAGKWTGAFNFNINLESNEISVLPEEKVLGDLVIPDANEWNGQVLSDIYVMEVGDIGILKATNDGEDVSDVLEITSSNEDVVKVENKQLKAVNTGQTTITTVYEDKSFSVKIKVVKPETPAHTHTAGETVKENEIAATYEKEGSYDEVTYCTICNKELSRTTKVIPKLIAAGLYDENDNLVKSWDELVELGLDIEKDYGYSTYNTEATSGYSVFTNNNLSGKLIIPNSITKIGNYAFRGCTSLTSVTVPNTVTSIGSNAFCQCTSLESITIPDSITNIAGSAFENCGKITSVTIPDSVTSIGDYAFNNCKSLTQVTIPDTVTNIGSSAFRNCTLLTQVTIPDSVTSIGGWAFQNCKSLTSVTIPDTVTNIGSSTFNGCTSLTSITIPDSVTSLSSRAFANCTNLTSITIPDTVTSIGGSTFENCTSLTSITYRGVLYTDKNTFNDKLKSDGVATEDVWI